MKDKCEKCGCDVKDCKCGASCNMGKHRMCCCKGMTKIISALIIAAGLVYIGHSIKCGCMMHQCEMMKVEKK